MASSSPPDNTANLQDRIDLATAQLQSLDENDQDYTFSKMLHEHILASLREQYEAAERAESSSQPAQYTGGCNGNERSSLPIVGNQRPQISDAMSRRSYGNFYQFDGANDDNFGGHFASDGVVEASRQPPPWSFGNEQGPGMGLDPANLPVTTGSTASASGSGSSPEFNFLRPQKRQRESLGLLNNSASHPNKSIRTTPSPAMTATTTPTSTSSFELPEDPDLLALFGGNPAQDMRDMREEQKQQERALQAKRQQEREDAEFARRLFAQEEDDFSSHNNSSRRSSHTTLPTTSQTILDNGGHYRRPTPFPISSPITEQREDQGLLSSAAMPMKQEGSYRSNPAPRENGGSYRPGHITRPPTDFIDLEDDAFLNQDFNTAGAHPSSDPVEIDPPSFGGYGQDNHGQLPVAEAYGSFSNPEGAGPSNWGYAGQLGQSLVGTANSIYNGAYNLLDNQLASYGSVPTGFGGTSVYGSNGQQSLPDIIDLDDYDEPPFSHDILNRHGINAQDPANRDLVASFQDRIDYVSHDPTRTSAEIKSLLENIRPDEDLPPENREGTPEAMTYPLMEHQKLGLAWMKSMEEGSNKGGILADDMGLGKTIQALALMVGQRSSDRACKTTLIVCPVALLKQWDREMKTKLKPTHQLRVYTLHADKREVNWAKLRTFDVVLTTFGTLGSEMKRREEIALKKRANPNWIPTSKNDYLPLLGDECKWFRVIIDEAQCIKNRTTKAALGAALLQAKTRFCMTGTPMMNNVQELYSLVHFLRIKPYCELDKFNRDFTKPLKSVSHSAKAKAMRQLQALLKAILLRRTKKSQVDGKPILNLPERTTNASQTTFSDDERSFYAALESRTQLQFNKYLKAGSVGRNYSNILVLLLRLRQACCHPHLIKDFGQSSGATDISADDMKKLAKELAPDVVSRIKELSISNDDLECPVCMDSAENATIFIPCGHNSCSECFARITDPSQAIAEGNAEGRAEAKCPNCRGKISPSKVIDHKIFKQTYMPELLPRDQSEDDPQADIETTDESDSGDTTDDDEEDEEVDSKGNLKNFIVEDGGENDASETEDEGDGKYRAGKTPSEKSAGTKSKKSNKGKGKAKEAKRRKKTLADLKKEGMRNIKAKKRYLKRLEKDYIPSAKTEKVIELLRTIQERVDPETKQCEKTIVFSQFTSLLDLLEIPIAAEGWHYTRFDGSMSARARDESVMTFSEKRDCKIMLVSLKAGNAGLNLVAASQVIILDPFWNPFVEEQAIDRAHRIGQQRPVQVHRILVPNTVEDRILALQEKKRELIEGALDEKASQSIGRLDTRELGFLFDVHVPA